MTGQTRGSVDGPVRTRYARSFGFSVVRRSNSVIVSSIDLVKRPEVRSALEEVPIDLLVVDEAHHLTPGSDRAAVVSELAERTPWVVLATATPHSGDESAYHFLCSLGAAGDQLVFAQDGGSRLLYVDADAVGR